MDKLYASQLKKNFDKKEFKIEASYAKSICWYITSLIFFRSGIIPFSNILVMILKLFGAKIGKEVRIKPHIHIKFPWKLTIGDYSWLAECYIENLDHVNIGRHVCISQQSMLLTGNHNYKTTTFDLITLPIILEDGVWIGAKSIVCPGVIAGSHAVLSTGSVATKNMEPYFIYQGNPAIPIRKRIIV